LDNIPYGVLTGVPANMPTAFCQALKHNGAGSLENSFNISPDLPHAIKMFSPYAGAVCLSTGYGGRLGT